MDLLTRAGAAVGVLKEVDGEDQSPEDEAPAASPTGTPVPRPRPKAPVRSSPPRPADSAETARLDAILGDELSAAVDAAPGAQIVKEFSELFAEFSDLVEDKSLLYGKVLKVLSKKGHTVQDLLGGFDGCIGALEDKSRAFEKRLAEELKKKVGGKQEAVQRLDAQIEERRRALAAIEQEISGLETSRDQEQSGISAEEQRLERTRSRFGVVYRSAMETVTAQRAEVERLGGQKTDA